MDLSSHLKCSKNFPVANVKTSSFLTHNACVQFILTVFHKRNEYIVLKSSYSAVENVWELFERERRIFFCLPFGALKPIFSIHVSKQLKNKKVDMNEKSNSSGICWSVVVVVYVLWAVLFTLHSVQLFENNFTQFVEMWKNIIDETEKMLWGNLSHRRLSNCLVCECNNDK